MPTDHDHPIEIAIDKIDAHPLNPRFAPREAFFPKLLYRGGARIEQTVGKLKRFKRVALRCEKTVLNYRSIVALALAFILSNSVHTT